jgi:hypothetical protein
VDLRHTPKSASLKLQENQWLDGYGYWMGKVGTSLGMEVAMECCPDLHKDVTQYCPFCHGA